MNTGEGRGEGTRQYAVRRTRAQDIEESLAAGEVRKIVVSCGSGIASTYFAKHRYVGSRKG